MLARSSGNHDWLLANASACVPFLAVFVYATHATQAIAFDWKPGLTCDWGTPFPIGWKLWEHDAFALHELRQFARGPTNCLSHCVRLLYSIKPTPLQHSKVPYEDYTE